MAELSKPIIGRLYYEEKLEGGEVLRLVIGWSGYNTRVYVAELSKSELKLWKNWKKGIEEDWLKARLADGKCREFTSCSSAMHYVITKYGIYPNRWGTVLGSTRHF